ncbi:MAG: helix-turn-helix domain-containing protein [Thermodesulfobacteriota bacterium]
MQIIEQEFVRLEAISQRYDITLSTLRRWCAERRFPIYKVSNRVRVSVREFEEWWQKQHVQGGRSHD